MYHEYSNKFTCRLCSSDIAFDGEGPWVHIRALCQVLSQVLNTEFHRILPTSLCEESCHHLRDRESEAARSGGSLRSQPVSGGPGVTPQVCPTEKSARCSRDHTLLSATGCSAYDLYLPEACLSVYSLTCKHRASVVCPHTCVYVFTLNSSLLFILFCMTHGHLIFPFLP